MVCNMICNAGPALLGCKVTIRGSGLQSVFPSTENQFRKHFSTPLRPVVIAFPTLLLYTFVLHCVAIMSLHCTAILLQFIASMLSRCLALQAYVPPSSSADTAAVRLRISAAIVLIIVTMWYVMMAVTMFMMWPMMVMVVISLTL